MIERFAFYGRGSVAQSVEHATPGSGFDPRCGRPLPTGWVGVSIPALSRVWRHLKLSDVSLGVCPR